MRRSLLALLLLAVPLAAHDFWMRPERFSVPSKAPLPVRLFVGEGGVGEAVLRDDARTLRFELLDAEGARPVLGRDGADPAGLVRVRLDGPQWLVFANSPKSIELEAAKFEPYLVAQGLDAIKARRAERGESGAPAKEIYSRCAKSLLRAGSVQQAAPSALVLAPVGLRLELVPLQDPGLLAPGADGVDFAVRVLFEGAPLAGVLVKATLLPDPPPIGKQAPAPATPPLALPFGAPAATGIAARSDADGRVSLHLPRGGPWLLCAEHMLVATGEASKDHDYESLWASLSFELPAP
jgi:uncharacterized GH25 family protein